MKGEKGSRVEEFEGQAAIDDPRGLTARRDYNPSVDRGL